ncbi:phosphoribosylglycinamide formyltransferase [Patescibacteria group bacterium]|nr:phosphoribosylglycinamide formyltransferase [Patescibacteria group bacterium]
MPKKYKIAVLASTNGTDLQAIIDEIDAGTLTVDLTCVISNVQACGALKKAQSANVPALFIDPKPATESNTSSDSQAPPKLTREEYDKKVAQKLDEYKVDLIVLVGYMRLFSPWFIHKYPRKIINIHPSLLPEFPGMDLDVHSAVIKAGRKKSGMTIHFVDEGMDTGEIILQKEVELSPDETPESLKEKVQNLEKEWYPQVIRMFRQGEIK